MKIMKMNVRNIERILDVLQFVVDHYNGKIFMDDDVYKACPNATSNIIDLLVDRDVITSTKDGNSFDDGNIEEYRSFLSDLEDEIEDLNLPDEEKEEIRSKFQIHINLNINLLNIDAGF